MKKVLVIIMALFGLVVPGAQAQKCLDLNILAQMGNIQTPGYAAQSFGDCKTELNSEGQTVIVNYGVNYTTLDDLVKRVAQDFTNAVMPGAGGTAVPGMSQSQQQAGMELATKLQNMSPDERKAYMVQYMQQNHATYGQPQITDNGQTSMMVMQAFTWATKDLYQLDQEMAAKLRDLISKETDEVNAVKHPSHSLCPGVDKEGLPACDCINKLEAQCWKQIVTIHDKYTTQKLALLQTDVAQIKVIVGKIEDTIVKLQYGDAVKTPALKRQLLSAQQSAWGNAFDIPLNIVKNVREEGSNSYVNVYNAGKNIYALDCHHGN